MSQPNIINKLQRKAGHSQPLCEYKKHVSWADKGCFFPIPSLQKLQQWSQNVLERRTVCMNISKKQVVCLSKRVGISKQDKKADSNTITMSSLNVSITEWLPFTTRCSYCSTYCHLFYRRGSVARTQHTETEQPGYVGLMLTNVKKYEIHTKKND